MGNFNYVAKTKEAQTIKDVETAGSKEELINKLKSRGLFIVSVKEIKTEKKEGSQFLSMLTTKRKRSSIKTFDLTFLARNMATTLSSGVTLLRSLELLATQAESGHLESILQGCQEDIKNGLSLSESIAKHPKVFSTLWRGIIEVGEASGNLPFVLDKLADYMEQRMEFERKIKGALVYPTILMSVSALAMFIFFKVILPKFVMIFTQFNMELPLPTKIVFSVSQFLEKNFVLFLIGMAGLVVSFIALKTQPACIKFWDKVSLKLPLLGPIAFYGCIERFTSTMYILLESGLPLVYTLDVSARGLGNSFIERRLMMAKDNIRDGASLSSELSKLNLLPYLVSEMTKVGEETGTMSQIFKKLSTFYQRELNAKVDGLVAAFEPLMIVVMGVVIGGIVIALFLPLFKIANASGSM